MGVPQTPCNPVSTAALRLTCDKPKSAIFIEPALSSSRLDGFKSLEKATPWKNAYTAIIEICLTRGFKNAPMNDMLVVQVVQRARDILGVAHNLANGERRLAGSGALGQHVGQRTCRQLGDDAQRVGQLVAALNGKEIL